MFWICYLDHLKLYCFYQCHLNYRVKYIDSPCIGLTYEMLDNLCDLSDTQYYSHF